MSALMEEAVDRRRWRPHVPATRQTLAVAVRRVGTAQGRDQTADRLEQLAAEAEAWARVLRAPRRGLR